jgi:phosphohistidine phosphatase SixA
MTLRPVRRALASVAILFAGALEGQETGARKREAGSAHAIDAARRGGYVIACRHAATDSFDENEMTLRYDDPATQRKLSPGGERQSEAMGRAFRTLEIPIAEVIASPMQRARRMAEIMFGEVKLDSLWHTRGDYYAKRREPRREALGQPVARGNRVIISHLGTLGSVIRIPDELEEGDCMILRPGGATTHDVVGKVSWREWLRAAGIRE